MRTGLAQSTTTFTIPQTIGCILCCKCGIPIIPNDPNMCLPCLRSEVDITEGLRKHLVILHCPQCGTYLEPPNKWINAKPESNHLLSFCHNQLKDDFTKNGIRVVDANFVRTEPNSKRIKVNFKIQKEIFNGAILEQYIVVEYVQKFHTCENCYKVQANPDQWVAKVQLRQHVSHKRTIFHVEQLILKHGAASQATKIQQVDQGIDLFFANRSHALKFVEFIGKIALLRNRHGKKLVSQDSKSNRYNYKYTFSAEICPICREDLICLPPKVAASLGNLGPLVICTKATNSLTLLDPSTMRQSSLNADQYWREPFKSLFTSRQLVEYIVHIVEPVSHHEASVGNTKYKLADAQVSGRNNNNISYIRTHLGHLLNAGDFALGYDISGANCSDIEVDNLPEVILIKKCYGMKHTGNSYEMELDKPTVGAAENNIMSEYEEFLRDLEENPELRFNISLRDNRASHSYENSSFTIGEKVSYLPLERFEDLDISEEEGENDIMRD